MSMDYSIREPIRILHIFGSMGCGGAETLIMNLYRNMPTDQVQFDFLVHNKDEAYYEKEIINRGGRILRIDPPKDIGLRQYSNKLKTILMEKGPFHGVHSHLFYFSGWILKTVHSLGIPLRIAHSHTTLPQKVSIREQMYYRFMRLLLFRYSTHFFACTIKSGISLFGSRFNNDSRSKVIRNAVDFSSFLNETKAKKELRDELGISEDAFVIGHVGRFDEVKNHKMIIQIFHKILQQRVNTQLILIGTGSLLEETREASIQLGIMDSVTFCGQRDDISKWMKAFDVFLFPSIREGLGFVLLEAQAAALPCVVSNTIPEEADLKVGLLQYVDLQKPLEHWASLLINHSNVEIPTVAMRQEAILNKGYDISSVSSLLGEVYGYARRYIKP